MKQKKNWNWRTFLAGGLTALLLAGAVNPALAAMAGKTIQVFTGVNIYIDDVKLNPKDANGNPVEAFIYNGTTYLPVRAIGEAVGKTVQWEGSTSSVYLGKHASSEPAVWLADLDYFSGTSNSDFHTSTSEQDNMGNTHYHCITHPFDRTYFLNGQYTALTGVLYQKYERRSWTSAKNTPNCVEIYGDGKLLYTYTAPTESTGIEPVEFNVDLTGVLQLRVYFSTYGISWPAERRDLLSLGDVGLWT